MSCTTKGRTGLVMCTPDRNKSALVIDAFVLTRLLIYGQTVQRFLLPCGEIVSFRGGYYEINILSSAKRRNSTSNNNSRREETISVGLAGPDFPLIGKQPGWDHAGCSFGYHGDDGKSFIAEDSDNPTAKSSDRVM